MISRQVLDGMVDKKWRLSGIHLKMGDYDFDGGSKVVAYNRLSTMMESRRGAP